MGGRSVTDFVVSIERAPDAVFAYLADVSKHAEWSPKPFRAEGTRGPVSAGDTFATVGSIPGDKSHRNDVTVIECVPPHRLVLDSVEKGRHFVNTFVVEPEANGTKLTRTIDAPQPPFPLSALFPLILAAFIRPDVNKGLRMLKAKLEGG